MMFDFMTPQAQLRSQTREACQAWSQSPGGNTRVAVKHLAETGLVAHMFPKRFGGCLEDRQFSVVGLSVIRESLGEHCPELDTPYVGQGLGGYPILLFGTPEQQDRYLPKLASGEWVGGLAITEPEAGSDVGSIACEAVADGDDYIISGQKKFITNGGVADFYVVFAKTDPTQRAKGLSAFIVLADTPGLSATPQKMITPHVTGMLTFDRCRVPKSNLLGKLGGGFGIAMGNLDIFRTTVGAFAVGYAQRALDLALERARTRVQFGKPLAEQQVIQFKLADMATKLRAARLMVYSAAYQRDASPVPVSLESSMAKLYATEAAFGIVNEAVQIFGGDGVSADSEIAHLFLEARMPLIYEGTSEIQRIVIGREVLKSR